MPIRKERFITGEIYHVFNKTINHNCVFLDNKSNLNFIECLKFYRCKNANISFSGFRKMKESLLKKELKKLLIDKSLHRVEILAYCLMPNHFHFLIRQKVDNGISSYMSDVINSYTRYYNNLTKSKGPIFLTQFRSKRIKSIEQLLHVSRYIHLNPYTNKTVHTYDELLLYPWSSLPEYLSGNNDKMNLLENKSLILSYFNKDPNLYKKFVLGRAEYQRTLKSIQPPR